MTATIQRFAGTAQNGNVGIEAKDEKRLRRFQKLLASYELLIIDELRFVPLSKTGAEMLFEIFSLRYERGATMVTSNLLCSAPHNRFVVTITAALSALPAMI